MRDSFADSESLSPRTAGQHSPTHHTNGGPACGTFPDAAAQHASEALDSQGQVPDKHHLMIVSNRLPVSVSRDPQTGRWSLPMSPGGLVSALLGVSQVRRISPRSARRCCGDAAVHGEENDKPRRLSHLTYLRSMRAQPMLLVMLAYHNASAAGTCMRQTRMQVRIRR